MQAKNDNSMKPRRVQTRLTSFVLILGLTFLLYFSYCFGLWGRNSLLLQHLFQCNCPNFSEELRYPKQVDVVVSACHLNFAELSPSGRLLYVKEKDLSYLFDLQTGDRIDVSKQPYSIFLTDDLGFIEYPEAYLVYRTTGEQQPIQKFAYWRQGAYIMGEANLDMLAIALRESQYVFFDEYNGTIIVLAEDYQTRPEQNFYLPRFGFPGNDRDQMKQFLQKNSISYQTIHNVFPSEVLSPDRRLVAKDDGIYLVENNKLIVQGIPRLRVRGWINNGTAAIYTSHAFEPCLFAFWIPMIDDGPSCSIRVPQPVIALKIPREYLLSASP
jgi:hypothetical protein